MKLKNFLAILLVCVFLMGMTACQKEAGNDASESPSPTSNTPANTEVELLRIGTTRENDTFNATTQSGAYGLMSYNSFGQGLFFERDENGDVQPGALESYSISEDNRSVTMTLPDELYWHDGEKVTTDDIVFTFEYGRDVLKSSSYLTFETIEVTGENTVKITFIEGQSAFAYVNGQTTWGKIYPKHIWENIENPSEYTGEDAVIGCGPYRFISLDKDAQISYYEAVDSYFKGELTVKTVSVKTYSSPEALVMALVNDEIDAIYNYSGPISPTLFSIMEGKPGVDMGISLDPGNYMLMFGYNEKPSNDYAFREAVSYALNYSLLGSTIYGTYSYTPTKALIPPSNMGFDDTIEDLVYDPDKAMELLDAAGYLDTDGDGFREYPDGTPMDVLITPQYNQSRMELFTRIATIWEENLKNVGIKTTLDEASMTSREAWSARSENGGTYQLYIGYCTAGIASYIGAPNYIVNYTYNNWWGTWQDPEYLAAYDAVKAVNNFDDYKEAMKELQRLNAEQLPAISLAWGTSSFPFRTDRYEGWLNYPGWGVINNKTWYTLRAKG